MSYCRCHHGLHSANGLNDETSYVIYRAYVSTDLLYGIDVLSLTKGHLDQLSKYHIQTLRNIQSLPQRTASATLSMLLGALPLGAELHKRQLSLLHRVLVKNECLKCLVQRQLACSFNNPNSFFSMVRNILDKYELPTLSQLVCSNLSKLQ